MKIKAMVLPNEMERAIIIYGKNNQFYDFYDVRYGYPTYEAIRECEKMNLKWLTMPELVQARIKEPSSSRVWKLWHLSKSIKATGKGKSTNRSKKGGNPYVIYGHVDNYLSDYRNLKKIRDKFPHLSMPYEASRGSCAAFLPEEEFQRLLRLNDNKSVFVVDYNKFPIIEGDINPVFAGDTLIKVLRDYFSLEEAINHPQTIPFFGGERLTEQYLKRYFEVYKKSIMDFCYSDDLFDRPLARLLALNGGEFGGINTFDHSYCHSGKIIAVKR